MDRVTKSNITIEASRKSQLQLQGRTRRSMEVNVDNPEVGRSITQVAWHPLQDLVALSSLNNLYIFSSSFPVCNKHAHRGIHSFRSTFRIYSSLSRDSPTEGSIPSRSSNTRTFSSEVPRSSRL